MRYAYDLPLCLLRLMRDTASLACSTTVTAKHGQPTAVTALTPPRHLPSNHHPRHVAVSRARLMFDAKRVSALPFDMLFCLLLCSAIMPLRTCLPPYPPTCAISFRLFSLLLLAL